VAAIRPYPLAKIPVSGPRKSSGDFWSIPLLCFGIAIVACCVLMPMAEANRRLAYQREQLKRDLSHLQEQVKVNDDFLKRVVSDPNLAERLAQRQMKMVREGTSVLAIKGESKLQTSPFLLVNVPKPIALAAYEPVSGKLGRVAQDSKVQLYLIGGALLLIAIGLMWESSPATPRNS
jgi:hypothetical protein